MRKILNVDNILIAVLISLILLYIFIDKFSFYSMTIIAIIVSQIFLLFGGDDSKDIKTSEIDNETGTREGIEDWEVSEGKKLRKRIKGIIIIGLMVVIIGLTVLGYFNGNW